MGTTNRSGYTNPSKITLIDHLCNLFCEGCNNNLSPGNRFMWSDVALTLSGSENQKNVNEYAGIKTEH